MSKSALYKHYKNKRDIFDHIVARMEQMDCERAQEYAVPEETVTEAPEAYRQTTWESIRSYSLAQLHYWTEDEFAASFRRMLQLEQYRSPEMGKLYQQYLAAGPVGYMEDLFRSLTGRDQDAAGLAVAFYSPMFLMYSLYDGGMEIARLHTLLQRHLDAFLATLL